MILQLSEKDKRALYILVIFLIAILYFRFSLAGNLEYIQGLKSQSDSVMAELENVKTKIASYKKHQDDIDKIEKSYFDISRKMPANLNEKFAIIDTKSILENYCKMPDSLPIISKKKVSDNTYIIGTKINTLIEYNNFKELLKNAKNYDVIYNISNLSLSKNEGGLINASFDMNFYSYEDKNAPVREWKNLSKTVGHRDIFTSSSIPVSQSSNQTGFAKNIDDVNDVKNEDFLILLDTIHAPTGSVLLEKSGTGKSIFGQNKMIEKVNIRLEGGKGQYKYSIIVNGKEYPKTGSNTLRPNSQDFVVKVSSLPRQYSDDNNVVIVDIQNKTDKNVKVYVENDDKEKPRAQITKSGEGIYVYKQ